MPSVFMIDGKFVPEEDARASFLGSASMFGYGALDRLR